LLALNFIDGSKILLVAFAAHCPFGFCCLFPAQNGFSSRATLAQIG